MEIGIKWQVIFFCHEPRIYDKLDYCWLHLHWYLNLKRKNIFEFVILFSANNMTFTNGNILNNRKQKPYTAHLHTIKRLGIMYLILNNGNHIEKMILYIQYTIHKSNRFGRATFNVVFNLFSPHSIYFRLFQ